MDGSGRSFGLVAGALWIPFAIAAKHYLISLGTNHVGGVPYWRLIFGAANQLALLPLCFFAALATKKTKGNAPLKHWQAMKRLAQSPRPRGMWDTHWEFRFEWAFSCIFIVFYIFDFAACDIETNIKVHHALSLTLHAYATYYRSAGFPYHIGGVFALEVGTGLANLYSANKSNNLLLYAYALGMTWSNAVGLVLATRWIFLERVCPSSAAVFLIALFMCTFRQAWCCLDLHRNAPRHG